MRYVLFSVAAFVGGVWGSSLPVAAAPLGTGWTGPNIGVSLAEPVGWRRYYRRYGYPVPYVYYPPAYGYYAPPPAYAYYPPAYGYDGPPPAIDDYPTANGGYGEYPPANGEYPPVNGDYGDYPPEGGS